MRGFSGANADLDLAKFCILDVFRKYYPKRLEQVAAVDSPWAFKPVWAILRPIIGKYSSVVKFARCRTCWTTLTRGRRRRVSRRARAGEREVGQTSEARAEGDISRGADDAKENSQRRTPSDRVSSKSHRAVSRFVPSSASAARGVRPLSSVIARSRFAAFHARCVAASVRQRSRRFISLFRARGLFSRCVRAFALMNAAFFRARFHWFTPARLVGEVVLRARALVVVLDGGVGFGVGRREARPRAGVRGPPRGRGSPPERRAPRSLGEARAETACGRFSRPRAVIGPAAEAFGGRARRRGLRAHARRHARDIPRDAAHRRAQRGHVHRSVGIDARDDLERPTLLQAERCRRQIHLCDFADVWFLADRRLDQSSPRRRWRQARR